jgi:hypothetical protein
MVDALSLEKIALLQPGYQHFDVFDLLCHFFVVDDMSARKRRCRTACSLLRSS